MWGLPTSKTDVIYLALEDTDWRIQQRMQDLLDIPPKNLHFGFSCGKLGTELEGQIKDILEQEPSTGLIFIDTLQMVRDNVSSKVNAYAQDYKDLSALKKIADDPKWHRKIFLFPKWRFSFFLLRKRNFLITIIPLIPTIIFLVLVKYVVKNRKGDAKLRHLLLTETLLGVYHRRAKMSSQLQRFPLP